MPIFLRRTLLFLILLAFGTAGAVTLNGNDPTTGQPANSSDPSTYGTSPTVTTTPTTPTSGVTFPENSTVAANSSVCETKRRASIGTNSQLYNTGKTAENMMVTYNALPCPTTWLAQTVSAISTSGLPGYISKLAFAVFFMGIIWTGIRIANGSEHSDGRELFARLLISGWLVFGSSNMSNQLSEPKFSGNMGEFVRATWVESYKWGDKTFATPALERASTQTANLGEHISRLVTLYAGLQVISQAVKSGVDGAAAGTVAGGNTLAGGIIGLLFGGAVGAGNAAAATTQAGIVAINMAMPILLTYYLIIMGTGLATVIASLLIPLVGAMFIFSTGLGMQYLETWFKTAASAVLMMALMPIVFAGSLELGFVEPAKNFDIATTKAEVSLKKDYDEITTLAEQGKISWGEEQFKKLVNVMQASLNKLDIVGYLNAMLTSLVLMAFSLMAGVYMLRIAQNWIIEFLSGVAAAVSGGGGAPKMGLGGMGSNLAAAGGIASSVGGGAARGGAQGAAVRSSASPSSGSMSAAASLPKSSPTSTPSMAGASGGGKLTPTSTTGGTATVGSGSSGTALAASSGGSQPALAAGSASSGASSSGAANNIVSFQRGGGGSASQAGGGAASAAGSGGGASNNIVGFQRSGTPAASTGKG